MTTATGEQPVVRPSDDLEPRRLIEMLGMMMLIRRFEERCAQSYQQGRIGGFCHLYTGQEASAVGTVSALRGDDPIITGYRDHGHALARGMDPRHAMAEMFGKVTGCSRGKGGSMHLFDKPHHMYGGHAIVAGQCPLGAGLAFAIRYLKRDNACLCVFGDGALNQGALHESMNLSAIWQLPIIWACENNRYSMGTSIDRGTSASDDLSLKAAAYGMQYAECNGMDVLETYDCVKPLADGIRRNHAPVFVNVKTYRYKGHSMSDPQKYRDREEIVEMQELDPIAALCEALIDRDVATQREIDDLNAQAKQSALEAVRFAVASPDTPLEELYTDVYAEGYGPYENREPREEADE